METPIIAESAFVAPGAQIIGNVRLCEHTSVWHNAVLRGDVSPITLGEGSNIQDNCTLHCDFKMPLVIGKNVTVGHNAVLHSCIIGDGTLIGMGSIILNGAEIGKGCIIAAGSLVTTGSKVPDGTLFMGSPATFKRALSDIEQTYLLKNAEAYIDLIRKYKNQ